MKKIISLLMTVVLIFGLSVTLVSCGAPKDAGAEIAIYLGGEVFDLDPGDYYVSSNAEQILSLIYEPLFRVNENGKLVNAAAKDYEVDEETREITIELRETYWSDSIRVKSSDFVYAWCERIINPVNSNPAAALFYDIEGVREAVKGDISTSDVAIKATEMSKITITYCEGADYKQILKNLASVAASPVRQDIVEGSETYWSKSANSIVTNGPFKVKTLSKVTGEFELVRNLGYHQDPLKKDYDNKVKPGALYTTFSVGEDIVSVSYEDIENKVKFIMNEAPLSDRLEYKKKADVKDHTSVYTYVFNHNHPLFADVNVRRALSLAIDREAIAEAIVFGKPANGFIPDVCGRSDAEYQYVKSSKDLEAARECLALADSALLDQYKSFTLTIAQDEESRKIAELVCAAWAELGFNVTVKVAEPVDTDITEISIDPETGNRTEEVVTTVTDSGIQYLVKNASHGVYDFDVLAVDWQTFSFDPAVALATYSSAVLGLEFSSGDHSLGTSDSEEKRANIAGWLDNGYDSLIDLIFTSHGDERLESAQRAEEYLDRAVPVCPIIFNQNFVFKSSKISGIDFDAFGNMSLENVKLSGYKKYLRPKDEE